MSLNTEISPRRHSICPITVNNELLNCAPVEPAISQGITCRDICFARANSMNGFLASGLFADGEAFASRAMNPTCSREKLLVATAFCLLSLSSLQKNVLNVFRVLKSPSIGSLRGTIRAQLHKDCLFRREKLSCEMAKRH